LIPFRVRAPWRLRQRDEVKRDGRKWRVRAKGEESKEDAGKDAGATGKWRKTEMLI